MKASSSGTELGRPSAKRELVDEQPVEQKSGRAKCTLAFV